MSDELLQYYDNELRYVKELAGEFAEAYPKIAGRLRISKEAVEDPHVERLIEGFAFLNARIRMKLDDMFPELTDGLLSMLYPFFIEPVPSAVIVEMKPSESLDAPITAVRGVALDTEEVDGAACRYRTAYDIDLAPIVLKSAKVLGRPLAAPAVSGAEGAQGCLRLRLECLKPDATFTTLGIAKLRFFIAAETRLANILHEVICNNTIAVAASDDDRDTQAVSLGAAAVRPVGFEREALLLPPALGAAHSFGLLSEFFCFPAKFLFFDIVGLDAKTLMRAGRMMDIYLYFDSMPELLERDVGTENFRLFCAPAVNVFPMAAEPIRLDSYRPEFRIVPDARRESTVEALRVTGVTVTQGAEDPVEAHPWFSMARDAGGDGLYWQAIRRSSSGPGGGGDDVFLAFADSSANRWLDETAVASVDLLCTNRNLPSRLPFGGGRPQLSFVETVAGVDQVRCITPPTQTIRPKRGRDGAWRLISQFSLNHLSLTGGAAGAEAFRELLQLHDAAGTTETRAIISMVREIESVLSTARAPGSRRLAFCSGVDVRILFDDSRFSGSGGYLLACILDRLLSRYCVVNSFSRLKVDLWKERTTLKRFPARAGDIALA